MNLSHALDQLTRKLQAENGPAWNQIKCCELTAALYRRSFNAPRAPKKYTILKSELYSPQEFTAHFDEIKKMYTWFHIEALGVSEGTLVVMFEHARERVQSETAMKVLAEKGPQVRYVTAADYGEPKPAFQIIDYELRTLEHIPVGFYDIDLEITVDKDGFDKWQTMALGRWRPKYLKHDPDYKRDGDVLSLHFTDPSAIGPKDFATFNVSVFDNKAVITLNWTPGNKGAQEALYIIETLLVYSWQVSGKYSVHSNSGVATFEGPLDGGQILILLGPTVPQWKLSEKPEASQIHFEMDLSGPHVVFQEIKK